MDFSKSRMRIITGSPRPNPNLQQSAWGSHFSTALLITVIAVLITSQPISPHALPPALGRAQGSRASPGNSRWPACVSKGKEMTQAGKKSKSRKRHNSSWACTSLQPGPHTELPLPRPRARGPARPGRSGLPRRARALDPAAASSGCARRAARKKAAQWSTPVGTALAGRENRTPARAAEPRAGRAGRRRSAARAGRAVHACQAAAQGPPPFSPGRGDAKQRGHRPGRWRHSPMVAMAAAAARARVSPPQPELHAGGPGGGDGSGPGSARGARAALWAPAASPGSGSGSARGRALWHGQGGPLHPRRSSARPSPASAAPLGPPALQSLSPAVAPSGHRSPPQERSEKQTAGRAARPLVCHSPQRPPIPGSRWTFVPPPLTSPANNREEVAAPVAPQPRSLPNTLTLSRQLIISTTR